jgi:hypothetical protein
LLAYNNKNLASGIWKILNIKESCDVHSCQNREINRAVSTAQTGETRYVKRTFVHKALGNNKSSLIWA